MDGLVTLQAKVTKTAAPFNGASVDVSGIKGDFTIVLRVTKLIGRAVLGLQDSVDAFANNVAGPNFHYSGNIGQASVENPNPIIKSVSRREWASLRTGATGGVLRLVLQSLTGTGASIEYDAYIQYAKNVTPPPSPYAADVQGFDGWPPEEEAKKREGGLTDKEKAYWDAEKKRLEEDERREKAEAKEKEKGGGLDRDAETKKTTVSPVSPGRR